MISFVQGRSFRVALPVASQNVSASGHFITGNLIVLTGSFNWTSGAYPVITVTDNSNNVYVKFTTSAFSANGFNFWMAAAISNAANTPAITVAYSGGVVNPTVAVMEYSSTTGWIAPVNTDGSSFGSGTGTTVNSGALFIPGTADDLLIGMYYTTAASTISLGAGFSLALAESTSQISLAWAEQAAIGGGFTQDNFSAVVSGSAPWSAAIWSLTARPVPVPITTPNLELVQSAPNVAVGSALVQQVTLGSTTTTGNMLVLTGAFPWPSGATPYPTIAITDSQGNVYTNFGASTNTGAGFTCWMAAAICSATDNLTVTVDYVPAILNPSIGICEFLSATQWIAPPTIDGTQFFTGTGTRINSGPLVATTNLDDLVIAAYYHGAPTVTSLSTGWFSALQQTSSIAIAFAEVTPAGNVGFLATQNQSVPFAATIWALQANPTLPPSPLQVITITTAVVNPTAFLETYPNRIPEDIYDSLEEQVGFIFVPYGPSYLN